ncbi:hypothetical protein J2S47_003063 [Streptomyces griseoviridis]|jgi:hypothetical protein|uniref:Uncharacterized protein n=1 Tax=Streptomyces griseoviridis TaxID=45398 RepID=A0ABT9LFR0_STRGD|nr:hypothetical protein [Streptomyces griseoviridis]
MWLSAVQLGNALPIERSGAPEFLPRARLDVAKVCALFAAFVTFMRPDLPRNLLNSCDIPDRSRPEFSSN